MIYEDFKSRVREASQQGAPVSGLVGIPALRRALSDHLSREEFDSFVLQLHADGLVHLMSHVDPEALPPEALRDCLCDNGGLLLYWLRWL